jgi:hypothetical protein
MKLSELKAKYNLKNGAKYEPDPTCRRCQGNGEHFSKVHKGMSFCACLFFEREFREEALSLIGKAVRSAFPPNPSDQRAGASPAPLDQDVGPSKDAL